MYLLDLLMLPVVVVKLIWNWIVKFNSSEWPTVQGTIISAKAVVRQEGRHREWVAEFGYCYKVDGEYYSGYYIRSAYIHDEDAAWRVAQGWEGQSVMVRYHPRHYDVTRLLPQDQPKEIIGNLP